MHLNLKHKHSLICPYFDAKALSLSVEFCTIFLAKKKIKNASSALSSFVEFWFVLFFKGDNALQRYLRDNLSIASLSIIKVFFSLLYFSYPHLI